MTTVTATPSAVLFYILTVCVSPSPTGHRLHPVPCAPSSFHVFPITSVDNRVEAPIQAVATEFLNQFLQKIWFDTRTGREYNDNLSCSLPFMPIWSTVSRVAGRAVISRVFTLGQAILVVVTVTTGPMKLSFTQTSRVTMRNVSNFFPMLKYGLYSLGYRT
ncbi:hypothetical protein BJV77DRAFT_622278 [Russula vinacea]|nr:hypothetical protein BJV77DRAFT_622278 [Russula vinacea]